MKRMITLLGLCVLTALGNAQTKEEIEAARGKVGINAVPKATLEIKPTPKNAEEDSDTNEGILIPRLSKLRVANIKTPEESTLVYIDDVSEGSGATVEHAVDSPGYYFFKEGKWVRVHDTTSPGFNALLHGEEAPASTLGNNGDFYITQKHKLLYGPKTDAGWGTPITLAGASGPTGPIGSSTGANFAIPPKEYICGPSNINQILRSVEGYFECKQVTTRPDNSYPDPWVCYDLEGTRDYDSKILYTWTYTGIASPSGHVLVNSSKIFVRNKVMASSVYSGDSNKGVCVDGRTAREYMTVSRIASIDVAYVYSSFNTGGYYISPTVKVLISE